MDNKEIKWIYSKEMIDYINKNYYPILVIVGPSGAGKTTLASYLECEFGNVFSIVKNYTTRPKRDSDNPNQFEYINEIEFENFKDNNSFFLARFVEFPFYGYLNNELYNIIDMNKIPIFMFRNRGLKKIIELINNVYIINIVPDCEMCIKHSRNEITKLTVDSISETSKKNDQICKLKAENKYIKLNNNYDNEFFKNDLLNKFIEKMTLDLRKKIF